MGSIVSRMGVRAASVGLLVAGVIGGVHLGQSRAGEPETTRAAIALPAAEQQEVQLLKARGHAVAADRAYRSSVESDAAAQAAATARKHASKARKKEKEVIAEKAAEKAAEAAENGGGATSVGPIPASCQEFSGNRATGCTLMLAAGFGIDQFPCLNKLWDHESGWNHKAENRSSGAYGIPQAYPGSKMSSVGSDWRTNPVTQIKWGLGYVKGRYDTPCGAWNNFQNNGSY